jgi:predicted  nucleic acid-binding Zn-ribbon protein
MNEIEDLKRKLDSKNRELRTLEDKTLSLKEDHSREMQKMIHKYTEIDSRAKRMIGQLDDTTQDGLAYKQKYESLSAQMETMKLQ